MPLFTREFVSCHAKPVESHLYNDPVMLICRHVFCRSCCLYLAANSQDHSITCPICSIRIPFDNPNRFASDLISHGTLASMVKQYLREKNNRRRCASCQQNDLIDDREKLCRKCTIEHEKIKKEIMTTMNRCDELVGHQKMGSREKVREEVKQLYTIIDQRATDLMEKIDTYQEELEHLVSVQEKTNEANASKHQPINIETVSTLVEPRLDALRNNEDFLRNIHVEKEIKRLNDEADRQIRLLKHKSDIVPILCSPTKTPSENLFGELRFQFLEVESKTARPSSMINTSGDASLQSIPPKVPMWTVGIKGLPNHLCVHPLGKSTLIFSCSSSGVISLLTYISPVTHDSPRYIRSFNLFPNHTRVCVQSFTVFDRFMLVHTQAKHDNGSLYFYTHDGILEHEPIQLSNPIRQHLADDNRLWAIDSITHTIFSHPLPLVTHEIPSIVSKREHFLSFDQQGEFIPFRLATNEEFLAILGNDLQRVFIYHKISREQIFTSQFNVGTNMSIWNIDLFPRDNSLLLKFDWLFDRNVKQSLLIHFNTKNQSVGRIEGKHCLGIVIGPNKEVLVGFDIKAGIIRCYM